MYREYAIDPALRSVAVCTWQHTSPENSSSRVVPDACVDILWDGTRLLLAGPDTRPVEVNLGAGTQILGLRFVPGAAGALLAAPASAVRDARVPLHELWGESARRLEERLQRAHAPQAALALLEAAMRERVAESAVVDPVANAVAHALRPKLDLLANASVPTPNVAQLSAAIGVSERQLLRRCDVAFGYGPKLLARVLRFQGFLQALRLHPQRALAELALSLGYADQAHLAHDTAELAGQTPRQLRARWSAG
jgi:AraC-like DNA-binding protein